MTFAPGLAANLATGDANYLSVLDEADAWVARNGLDLPEEPEARVMAPDPDCVTDPILSLDLAAEGITSIVWATGYALDFGWLKVDAFDENGQAEAPARRLGRARGSTSSACPGCRGAARRSSGASGTTRSSWPTISPSSGPTSPTPRSPAGGSRRA